MRKEKGSEFIYSVDLEHVSGGFGVWSFKTFYDRLEAVAYCEKLAKNNPEISVTMGIRPRITKKNVLARG